MNGVTIIKEHLCRVIGLSDLISVGLIVTAMFVGILMLYRWIFKNNIYDKDTKVLTTVCSIVIVILLALSWVTLISQYNTTHLEYTVKVDDSVGFNEFFDRYEIVSVDGDEYRVKEIDD